MPFNTLTQSSSRVSDCCALFYLSQICFSWFSSVDFCTSFCTPYMLLEYHLPTITDAHAHFAFRAHIAIPVNLHKRGVHRCAFVFPNDFHVAVWNEFENNGVDRKSNRLFHRCACIFFCSSRFRQRSFAACFPEIQPL